MLPCFSVCWPGKWVNTFGSYLLVMTTNLFLRSNWIWVLHKSLSSGMTAPLCGVSNFINELLSTRKAAALVACLLLLPLPLLLLLLFFVAGALPTVANDGWLRWLLKLRLPRPGLGLGRCQSEWKNNKIFLQQSQHACGATWKYRNTEIVKYSAIV